MYLIGINSNNFVFIFYGRNIHLYLAMYDAPQKVSKIAKKSFVIFYYHDVLLLQKILF